MLACNKVVEREAETGAAKTCPNEAVDEVLVTYNQLPYAVPMCWDHRQEFRGQAAAARARRNQANAAAKERAEARANARAERQLSRAAAS